MNTVEAVETFLETLGTDADSVAKTLKAMGVKGVSGSIRSCPLANAVKDNFGIKGFWIHMDAFGWPELVDTYAGGATPPAAATFIDGFDRECYPELIA